MPSQVTQTYYAIPRLDVLCRANGVLISGIDGRASSVHLISPRVVKDVGPSPHRGQLQPLTSLAEASPKGY